MSVSRPLANAKSRQDIRNVAELIRKIQKPDNDLYFDIIKFLECTLPQLIPKFTFSIAGREEMGECHGLTSPDRNEIVIREDVYLRACKGSGRDRLTLAHELYHYLEHSSDSIVLARTEGAVPKFLDPEWQADAFGGELLIPYDAIRKLNLSPKEIQERCGVSSAAANFQYKVAHKNGV